MRTKVLVVALFVAGAIIVLFQQNLQQFAENLFSSPDTRPEVGVIEDFHGEVDLRDPEHLNPRKAEKSQKLRNQDTLTTGHSGQAILHMKNGLVIEIQSESSLSFEQLEYTLITFQRGTYKVLQGGSGIHEVIILIDGKLQDPEGRNLPAANLTKTENEETEETAPTPPPAPDGKTLSDNYIATVVQNQKGFMNRCYALHLKNQPQAKGEVDLTFTIVKSGEVNDVKILKNSLGDMELQNCLKSVFERTRFRSFASDPVIVNYPIYFE